MWQIYGKYDVKKQNKQNKHVPYLQNINVLKNLNFYETNLLDDDTTSMLTVVFNNSVICKKKNIYIYLK